MYWMLIKNNRIVDMEKLECIRIEHSDTEFSLVGYLGKDCYYLGDYKTEEECFKKLCDLKSILDGNSKKFGW